MGLRRLLWSKSKIVKLKTVAQLWEALTFGSFEQIYSGYCGGIFQRSDE